MQRVKYSTRGNPSLKLLRHIQGSCNQMAHKHYCFLLIMVFFVHETHAMSFVCIWRLIISFMPFFCFQFLLFGAFINRIMKSHVKIIRNVLTMTSIRIWNNQFYSSAQQLIIHRYFSRNSINKNEIDIIFCIFKVKNKKKCLTFYGH